MVRPSPVTRKTVKATARRKPVGRTGRTITRRRCLDPVAQPPYPKVDPVEFTERTAIRWHYIVHWYAAMVREYRQRHPKAYQDMLDSKTYCTDRHVRTLLQTMDALRPAFEDDVLFAVRYVWASTMLRDPTVRATVMTTPEERRLCEPNLLIHALGQTGEALDRVYSVLNRMKNRIFDHWERTHPRDHGHSRRCCVLLCTRALPPSAFVMNSLAYCDEHIGLALFNGLRHALPPALDEDKFCRACQLWSIMGLRTLLDYGHQRNHQETLEIPLRSSAQGPLRVRYTLFHEADTFLSSRDLVQRFRFSRLGLGHPRGRAPPPVEAGATPHDHPWG